MIFMKRLSLFMSAVILMAISCAGPQISELTCEGLAEPLGIDSTSPHFSWKVSGAVGCRPAAVPQVRLSAIQKGRRSRGLYPPC